MKKWLLIVCALFLVACGQDEAVEPVVEPEEVIVVDDKPYHNVKLKTYNNTIPHIIKNYVEMDDDKYGSYIVEMYDTNYEAVWRYMWRDMNKDLGPFALEPVIYENMMIVNAQGVVSVHDLVSGEFKWELETSSLHDVLVHEGVLYVLNYMDNYITGVSLENGKIIYEVKDKDYQEADAIAIENDKVIAYKKTKEISRNALCFDMAGKFVKKNVYMEEQKTKIFWDKAESSDESLEAINLIDGQTKTVWTESVKGYGEKEWVEITKTLPVTVSKLYITNGDHSSEKSYNDNAKLKEIVLSVGDGKSFTYKFDNFEYGVKEEIKFVKPVVADYILLTIVQAEPGDLFKNTCISEIETE